jgi:hypothetical protein
VDHEKRAEDLEREADELEEHSDEVEGEIDEAKRDWESKKADPSVPGAPSDADAGGSEGGEESDRAESDQDSA